MDQYDFDLRKKQEYEDEIDRRQAIAESVPKRIILEDLEYDEIIEDLLDEVEVSPFLSRCFRNLDKACKGEQIGLDAITTSLHNLREEFVLARIQQMADE